MKPNVFRKEFIRAVTHFDYPASLYENCTSGPWNVRYSKKERGWIVQRKSATRPFGVFTERETALLMAAVLPAVDRKSIFTVHNDERLLIRCRGGQLEDLGALEHVGSLVEPLHTAHTLLSLPDSLAWFLMAPPGDVLERAGAIAMRRLRQISAR